MKQSLFLIKNHRAKKTMPILIRFLKSKISGFVLCCLSVYGSWEIWGKYAMKAGKKQAC